MVGAGVVRVGAELGIDVGVQVGMVGADVGVKVSAEVGMEVIVEVRREVGAEVGIATAEEMRRTGSIVGVFGGFKVGIRGFEVGVVSSGKS
jgi:hypothetical protein